MKKILSVLFAAGMLSMMACGGTQDNDEMKRKNDSIATQKTMDSLFNLANQNIEADTIKEPTDTIPK